MTNTVCWRTVMNARIGFKVQVTATDSHNDSFRQKLLGVPVGSDDSEGTLYPLTAKYTLPIAKATGHV